MLHRSTRLAGLTLLFALFAVTAAQARTHVSVQIGIGAPVVTPVPVAPVVVPVEPAPYAAAPYPYVAPPPYVGYVWQPGYRVWTGYGYRWVPGLWVRPAYGQRVWPSERWERDRRGWERGRRWDRDDDDRRYWRR